MHINRCRLATKQVMTKSIPLMNMTVLVLGIQLHRLRSKSGFTKTYISDDKPEASALWLPGS